MRKLVNVNHGGNNRGSKVNLVYADLGGSQDKNISMHTAFQVIEFVSGRANQTSQGSILDDPIIL